MRLLRWTVILGAVAFAAAFWATRPVPLNAESLIDPDTGALWQADLTNGEVVFAAAGCGSCHAADDTQALAGGKALVSDFGTFYAPNISSDPIHGIGAWSTYDLANSILAGVSPKGGHYYPAFPFGSYTKLTPQDVVDLSAYLQSLPADATPSRPHDLSFPFNIRRAVSVWKTLYLNENWVLEGDLNAELSRGRYLVEAAGHCAECHTPRTALGGLDVENWMRGAPNPSGDGRIPSIHPDDLGWSAFDIAIYLESGFTPDFDTVGGSMVDVVENTAKLPEADRDAIAAYLLALD